ncbi:rhomboid family intramembrane serine protease [Corynebacterium sp. AOP36-E1-14]|uniref:rhomboid family intramembrane serine protease n=1 Tax=Corynebacterium sp. AOP34-BR1-29 TaxID=3457688 RepID=UPI0026567398|nr:rhomboid family intramembrane serine protease [Corynebacterium sp.]MDN6325320.1 rhomboid family intramembrane serine protease [Corynebacterium sp.]
MVYVVTGLDSGSLARPASAQGVAWDLMVDPHAITADGEWWRLLTGAFVHLDPGHLLMNMLLIGLIGRELERAYGTLTMVVSMVLCAVGGGLAVMWLQPDSLVGGASTIGYGMFAMLVGLSLERRTDVRAPLVLIVVNLLYSVTAGGVSLPGHLGGLAAGALVAVVLTVVRRGRGGRSDRATSSPWSSTDPR